MNRRILLVAHPRRPEALTVAKGVIDRLTHLGIEVSLQADEAKVLDLKHSKRVHIATDAMVAEETVAEAAYMRDKVLPAMDAVRAAGDALERIVADDLWPLPKYSEMLFIR